MEHPPGHNPTGYDEDVYAWAFEQSEVLRELASTRRDLPNGLDVDHLREEIEGVARTELRAAESFLQLLFVHLLKLVSAPTSRAARHWRAEAIGFHEDLIDTVTPSMRDKLRLDKRWQAALARTGPVLELEGDALLPGLPATSPLSLDAVLAPAFDLDEAIALVAASANQASAPPHESA